MKNAQNLETEDTFGLLLELAANDDLEAFKAHVDRSPSLADEAGPWYGRHTASSQMALHRLTPLMVAATFGSLDVLRLLASGLVDVNRHCGVDKATALHCAASGGSPRAPDAAKALLAAGADPSLTDANGRRPFDVVFALPNSPALRHSLQTLLATDIDDNNNNNSDSILNSKSTAPADTTRADPSSSTLPDIKNSIYSTDEFRMFSFKVRACSRAYSHDWTECPFVHPGENARRRDPRKHHYSCVPCPDFRKGACRRGDVCEYAHGVFECWLHPAQYRTRLCKDGTACLRRVCFFAHTADELRPLYISTGSAVPSPRHASSPSFTPPMSPNGPGWSRLRSSLNARDIFSPEDSFSPRKVEHSMMQSPLGVMSPRNNADPISPMGGRVVSMLGHQQQQHEQFRSLSSRDLDEGYWSKWGEPNGQAEWAVTGEELVRLRRSSSFEIVNDGEEEPDLSWVQSLVKETPQHDSTGDGEGLDLGNHIEEQSILGAWLKQMQLDQLMAQ